ncbi:hypothetical protein MKW92_037324 [Papaver armeniacum]|nr:hypothetical protein MKW92_037324 [Papaver armeniacum]
METFMLLKWFINSIGTVNFGYKNSSSTENHDKKKFNKISAKCGASSGFQMPLHYPRYKKSDYEKMEERKVDMLL